ncbi:MAG: hypothetical protein H7831_08335 [Magnetococcus sp. WYHC-3]
MVQGHPISESASAAPQNATLLTVRVISQHPPGGRCTLYADYAQVLGQHLPAHVDLLFSEIRDAHGQGFPSLWIDSMPVKPGDGVILAPEDILAALRDCGLADRGDAALAAALEQALERLLDAG